MKDMAHPGLISQPPSPTEPQEDPSRELALLEYDRCRTGIENYDDHLFRIRSWNIALCGLLLAAFFGINVGSDKNVAPSTGILIYTSISFCFWMLDSFNKSLQMVHILNSRDLEAYLRGYSEKYIGPSISMRFQRKEKRHFVATVKNLLDKSVALFYIPPIVIFCVATLSVTEWPRLCYSLDSSCGTPPVRKVALAMMATIAVLLFFSWCWSGPKKPWLKYLFRPNARERFEKLRLFLEKYPMLANTAQNVGPFHADASIGRDLIFFDRRRVALDEQYRRERKSLLGKAGYSAHSAIWDGKRPWYAPLRSNGKIRLSSGTPADPLTVIV